MTHTTEQVKGAIEALKALADTIREVRRIPSGELYARIMGHVDLGTYNKMIGILKNAGVIREVSYELIWNL